MTSEDTATNLTSRQVRAAQWLLAQTEPQSVSTAAGELRMSPRVVRTSLDGVARWLAWRDLTLHRKRGVGVWVEGTASGKKHALAALDATSGALRVYSAQDRSHLLRFAMLLAAPNSITIDELQQVLEVSQSSARRDLKRNERWFEEQGLFISRRPGTGISLRGPEMAIRSSITKLLLEALPAGMLTGAEDTTPDRSVSAGLREFIGSLPLEEARNVVMSQKGFANRFPGHAGWLAADLAVIAHRCAAGCAIELEAGQLRSMTDHPVWETAEALALALQQHTGVELDEIEIGGLTQHLLGLVELSAPADENAPQGFETLVNSAVALAAERLHVGLKEDAALVRNLRSHVERLQVRLNYGLPVHNPLLAEVAQRYPDVHEVAIEISTRIGEALETTISEDEAGFVTMYLSGALERLRLRPRTRAIVVCPTGMATAWILVSRIQAEFPELDLVDVISAGAFKAGKEIDADIIISTIAVENTANIPVVVVSPLLESADTRRIKRNL